VRVQLFAVETSKGTAIAAAMPQAHAVFDELAQQLGAG
jgi:hypothetical protein